MLSRATLILLLCQWKNTFAGENNSKVHQYDGEKENIAAFKYINATWLCNFSRTNFKHSSLIEERAKEQSRVSFPLKLPYINFAVIQFESGI